MIGFFLKKVANN